MFSYLGSKSKLAPIYPRPKYGRIIEPFAGSARYSLLHFENDVILYDVNPTVYNIWLYLLTASKKDILSLPDIESKVSLDTHKMLSQVERDLIGFHLCRGKAKPRKVGHGQNSWNKDKRRIAADLYKIKHWQVRGVSYDHEAFKEAFNDLATWFIDPPYKNAQERPGNSDRYPHGSIDYNKLANFIRTRNGLVIACEGEGADYLPFEFLTKTNANTNNKSVKQNKEFYYVQDNFDQIKGAKTMTAKKNAAATAVAENETEREPTTFDISKRDELMDLGFRVEQNVDGFVAFELMGDRQVPPADQEPAGSLPVLVTLVREEVQRTGISDGARVGSDFVDGKLEEEPASPSAGSVNFKDIVEVDDRDPDEELSTLEDDLDENLEIELEEDGKGNAYLPGTAPIVDQHIANAAGKAKAINTEWKEAGKKRKMAYDELIVLCHTKEHLFKPDPENTHAKIYKVGGFIIRLKNETKEKVEVDDIEVD